METVGSCIVFTDASHYTKLLVSLLLCAVEKMSEVDIPDAPTTGTETAPESSPENVAPQETPADEAGASLAATPGATASTAAEQVPDSEKPLGKSDHGDDAGAVADESPAAVVVQSGEAGESADGEEKPTVTPDEAADQDSDHVPIAESHPELTSPDAAGKSADTPSDTTAESAEAGAIDSSPEVATDSAPDGAAASVQEVAADSALEVAADEGSVSQDDPAVSTEPGEAAAEPLPESAADATASPQDIAEGGAVVPEQDSGGAGEAAVTDEASVTGGGAAAEEAGTPYDPPTEEAGNEPDAPITEEPAQPSTDVAIPEKPDDENTTVMDAALETDNAGAGEQPVLRAEDGPADSVAADEPAAAVDDDVPPMPQEEPAEDTAVTDGASTVQLDEGSKHGPPEEGQDATADAVSDQPLSTESAMDEGGKMEADTPEIPTEAATEVIVQEDMPEAANAATTADSAAPEVDPTPEATTETLPAVVATTENAPIVGDVDAETPTQADACAMETHADLEVMSIACMEGDSAASSPIAAVHSNDNTCGTKERPYGKTETMRGRERVRKYLEDSVVPTLRKGMRELVRTKPDDPFQFLADYLITNKPSIEG